MTEIGIPPRHARRRIGVMGGTFDPVHHGHLVAASEVQAWFDLDEVAFVPTGEPWQKASREVSPAEDRYWMTVIATASNPRFWVSRVDIDRHGPTYTIDTLRDLNALMPDADVVLAKPGVVLGGQPGRPLQVSAGLTGPGQVGAAQRGRPQRGEVRRGGRGLLLPDRVELHVRMSLRAAGIVPGGAAVPQQDQPPTTHPDAPDPRPDVTESGSSTSGQSRHSRSRA